MLNYERISGISSRIVECDNAMEKLKDIAKKLADTKSDLDVEITITEGTPPPPTQTKPDHRQNVGQPVVVIMGGNELFGGADMQNIVARPTVHYNREGLSQKGMPNELALVMLEQMSNYYKRQKIALEFLIIEELSKMDVQQLAASQQLEN